MKSLIVREQTEIIRARTSALAVERREIVFFGERSTPGIALSFLRLFDQKALAFIQNLNQVILVNGEKSPPFQRFFDDLDKMIGMVMDKVDELHARGVIGKEFEAELREFVRSKFQMTDISFYVATLIDLNDYRETINALERKKGEKGLDSFEESHLRHLKHVVRITERALESMTPEELSAIGAENSAYRDRKSREWHLRSSIKTIDDLLRNHFDDIVAGLFACGMLYNSELLRQGPLLEGPRKLLGE